MGWAIHDELPLATRRVAYSLWKRRQYSSILRQTSSLEMTLWVFLRLHSLKHTPLVCQRGHMWTLLRDIAVVFTVAKFPASISFTVLGGGSFVVASVLTITTLVSVIDAAAG